MLSHFLVQGQQDMSLYQFRELNQSSYLNPAFSGDHKVSVGLPGISSFYFAYNNNAFSASDIFASDLDVSLRNIINSEINSSDFTSSLRNPAEITSSLADMNYLMTNLQLDLFHLQINKGRHSFGFNVTEKVNGMIIFPKSLFELIQNGNGGANLGKTISINGLGPDFNHYREFGLSYSQNVNGKLNIGGRLKILSGMENVSFSKSNLGWITDELDYSWDIKGSYALNTSGVTGGMTFENLLKGRGNRGFGVDLGATYNLTDKINLSASVSDLGFINWSNNNMIYSTDDFNFNYDGIDLSELNDTTEIDFLVNEIYESAIDSLNGQVDSTTAYTTRLHPRIMLGGNYQVNEKLNVGLLMHGQFFGPVTKYGASVSANYKLLKSLSAIASYTVTDKSYNNIGLGVMFDKNPVQIYAVTDNILGLKFNNAQNVHARVGINLTFGNRNPKPDSNDLTNEAEPQFMANEEMEGNQVDTVVIEKVEVLPPVEEKPEVKASYELHCEVMDAETNLEITGIIVEVYKKEMGGVETLSSNRPYNSGYFLKQLDRSLVHRIVVKKAGYEDSALFIFPDDVGDLPMIKESISLVSKEKPVVEEVVEVEEEVRTMVSAYELTSRTSLRSEASSTSIVLERISVGTLMELVEKTNKYWWKVSLNGVEGYVKAAYLVESDQQVSSSSGAKTPVKNYTSTSTETGTGSYYFLIEKTSLRAEATSSSAVLLRFSAGDEVELVDKTNKYWWKVIFNGKVGYVKAAKLEE